MSIEAWHFLPTNNRLGYGDDRRIEIGKPLSVTPPLTLCTHGLHASLRAIDALMFAQSSIISRVVLDGETHYGRDKLCAETRTPLWIADVSCLLHEFACWCAEQALNAERAAGREPHKHSWNAIAVKRSWLGGVATDQELSAAESVAWSAAWSVTRDAQNTELERLLNIQRETV